MDRLLKIQQPFTDRKRVLLIEDDPADAELINSLLEGSDTGFECTHAPCLADGLAQIPNADIVMLDLSLPDAMGFNMLKELRVRAPDLPVILMTGFDDKSLAVKAVSEGAQDYLAKNSLSRSIDQAQSLGRLLLHASARKRSESALQASYYFLDIVNRHNALPQLLPEFTHEIQKFTACAAVAIRLLDQNAGLLPFTCSRGFEHEFAGTCLLSEQPENICSRVANGMRQNGLRTVTENGSFFCGSASQLRQKLSATGHADNCSLCHQYGYESLALVPIRHGNQTCGIMHLADRRGNVLPAEMIAMLDNFAKHLGTAIQRIKAETSLQQREVELSAVFNHAPFAMIALDRDGRILDINRAGAKFVGKTAAEIIGLNAGQAMGCVHAFTAAGACRNAPQCTDCAIRNAVISTHEEQRGCTQAEVSLQFQRGANKRDLHLVISTTYVPDDGGKVVLYVEDVSKRKRGENNLRLFRYLIMQAHDALLIVEAASGRVCEMNQCFCEIAGYSRPELLLLTLADLLEARDREALLHKLHLLQCGEKCSDVLPLRGKNSAVHAFQCKCTKITYPENGMDYWVLDLQTPEA